MYVCKDCGRIFEDAKHYTDTHGLDSPPYEGWSGCPSCGGDYGVGYTCDGCGEYIVGTYIKLQDGQRLCDNCYNQCDTDTDE